MVRPDGLLSAGDGKMYVSSPQDNAIKVSELSGNGEIKTLIQDARLGLDGTIYSTTSHIQDSAFYKTESPAALPTELWSIKRAAASVGSK